MIGIVKYIVIESIKCIGLKIVLWNWSVFMFFKICSFVLCYKYESFW